MSDGTTGRDDGLALERWACLQRVAQEIALGYPGFYGSVKINFQGGKPVNANVEESIRLTPP